jgi:hypothetical protein
MTFYKVDTNQQKLEKLESISFADNQWQERTHLQPLLRDNPESIDPNLLIIADEFSNWEDSKRRIDLLALDTEYL